MSAYGGDGAVVDVPTVGGVPGARSRGSIGSVRGCVNPVARFVVSIPLKNLSPITIPRSHGPGSTALSGFESELSFVVKLGMEISARLRTPCIVCPV